MMLGGVPIRVIRPPRIEAKDSGMRVRPTARLAFFAAWMSTGISNASAPTLFITAESPAARDDMTKMCRVSVVAAPAIARDSRSTAPELESPRETMSTMAITTVAGWPKPRKAWSTSTTPSTTAARSAAKATRS